MPWSREVGEFDAEWLHFWSFRDVSSILCSTFFRVFVTLHHNFRSRSQWPLVSSWTSSSSSRSSKSSRSSRIWRSSKELNSDAKRPWHDKVQKFRLQMRQDCEEIDFKPWRFFASKNLRLCIQFIREDLAFRPCITLAKSYGISDMKDVACCTTLCLGDCLSKFRGLWSCLKSAFMFFNVLHMCSQGHRMHSILRRVQELLARQRHLCTSTQTRSPASQDLDWSLKPFDIFSCYLHFFYHWMCCHVLVLSCFDPQPTSIHTQKHNETIFLLVKSLLINEIFVMAIFLWDEHTDLLAKQWFWTWSRCPALRLPRTQMHWTTLPLESDQGLTSTHIRHGGRRKYDWNIVKQYAQIKHCLPCIIIIYQSLWCTYDFKIRTQVAKKLALSMGKVDSDVVVPWWPMLDRMIKDHTEVEPNMWHMSLVGGHWNSWQHV